MNKNHFVMITAGNRIPIETEFFTLGVPKRKALSSKTTCKVVEVLVKW